MVSKQHLHRLVDSTNLPKLKSFYLELKITVGKVLSVLVNPTIMKELAETTLEMINKQHIRDYFDTVLN